MTTLIATLGAGKGTWTLVQKLIAAHNWDKVFLVTNSFGKEKFQYQDAEFVLVDENMSETQMVDVISSRIRGRIAGFEVAVNIVSGSGKEHMALISAVIKSGMALRLVSVGEEGLFEV